MNITRLSNEIMKYDSNEYYYADSEVKYHHFIINAEMLVPAPPTFSMFVANRFIFGKRWSIDLLISPRFFTKTAESLMEFQNPDGIVGTVIISPVTAFTLNDYGMSKLQLGGDLSYVVTRAFTMRGGLSYFRFTVSDVNGFGFSLRPSFHLRRSLGAGMNADGNFGSFHLHPQYKLRVIEEGTYHFFSFKMTVPFNRTTTGVIGIGWGGGSESPVGLTAISRGFLIRTGISFFTR